MYSIYYYLRITSYKSNNFHFPTIKLVANSSPEGIQTQKKIQGIYKWRRR